MKSFLKQIVGAAIVLSLALPLSVSAQIVAANPHPVIIKAGKLVQGDFSETLKKITEQHCCEALENFNDGTATVSDVNDACHTSYDEGVDYLPAEALYRLLICHMKDK